MTQEADVDQARELVTQKVLSARSLPDVREARQVLRDWIKSHPEDEGMRDGFEQLSLMQDIAEEEQASQNVHPASQEAVLTR